MAAGGVPMYFALLHLITTLLPQVAFKSGTQIGQDYIVSPN